MIAGLVPARRAIYFRLPETATGDPIRVVPNGTTKLTAELVRTIRQRVAAGETLLALAGEYGVKHNTLSDAVNRVTWKQVA